MISRRTFLGSLTATVLLACSGVAALAASSRIAVHKDPNCSCCGAWVDHQRYGDRAAQPNQGAARSAERTSVLPYGRNRGVHH